MGQRIVINLDAPKDEATQRTRASGRKRRRWPRVLAVLFLLVAAFVVVAAAGGFLWWRHYQTTPAYTATLLVDAAQKNDAVEFQKYIDDDAIAKNMVANVSQKAAARYGVALNSSIQQQIDNAMPSVLPRLKPTIHDEVLKEIRVFAAKSDVPFIYLVVNVPRMLTVSTESDTAKVKAPLSDRTIELTMQRNADRWKVTEIKDDVVVQHIVDQAMKDLPAIGSADPLSSWLNKQATKRHNGHK